MTAVGFGSGRHIELPEGEQDIDRVLSLALTEKAREFVPPQVLERYVAGTPTGRLSEPDGIADAIVFLASAANRNIAGAFLSVTGGR